MTSPGSAGNYTGGKPREVFSARSVFVFAAIGSAVGLGNIWRFPFVSFANGGGAFLVPYIVALLSAGVPLLFFDYAIGHRFRGSAPLSFRRMSKFAEPVGWIQVLVSLVIAVYYAVVVAWAASYAAFSVNLSWGKGYEESEEFFSRDFLSVSEAEFGLDFLPGLAVVLAAVWIFTLVVIGLGVHKGIGATARIFVPLLIVLFVAMVTRSLFLPGALDGLDKFFTPDWAALRDPTVWIAAYGQIFFSLSVSFGIMITYASYLKKRTNLTGAGLVVAFSNSAFEVLAGIGVFSALGFLVRNGSGVDWSDIEGGPGLAFIAFPALISEMPAGPVFGVAFFLCLILAGLTSLISIVEVVISALRDKFNLARVPAVVAFGIPIAVISMLLMPTTTGLVTLDILDKFVNNIGIIGVAIIALVSVAWVMRRLPQLKDHLNSVSSWRVGAVWMGCLAVLTPAILGYTLFREFRSLIDEGYESYSDTAIGVWGWGMLVFIVITALILTAIPWNRHIDIDGVPSHGDSPHDAGQEENSTASTATKTASPPNYEEM